MSCSHLYTGHQQAWEVGILHRDVSVGNVLIAEYPEERMHGFLHDFDYSSMTKFAPVAGDSGWEPGDPLSVVAEEYNEDEKERTVRDNDSLVRLSGG